MYDYKKALVDDIWDTLEDYADIFASNAYDGKFLIDCIYDDLMGQLTESPIVVGAIYGHTPQSEIEKRLAGNWDLMMEAHEALDQKVTTPQESDITIRCYLLPNALDEVMDDIKFDAMNDPDSLEPWLKDILDESIEEEDDDEIVSE